MYLSVGAGVAMAYMALAITYPAVWAVLTMILFVGPLGLITAKVVFRIDNPLKMWCWTPVFGLGWLAFLWILFQLKSLFW